MKESSGRTYLSSRYAKALCVSEAKVGKSSYLVAQSLGVFPGQEHGGLVSKAQNLHVITFDANALGGIKRFLLESCGADDSCLDFNVYNMQDDAKPTGDAWDHTLINTFMQVLQTIEERTKKGGVHVVLISSLTGLAQALERTLAGPPGGKKGAGMDMAKWGAFKHQINEVRNRAQLDLWHCLWEGHIYKPPQTGQDANAASKPETLQISGQAGQTFPYNVEQVFRIRRMFGQKVSDKVDSTYLDTKPSLDFISGGRSFTEALKAKEPDMTLAFSRLGLAVGQVNNKSGKLLKTNPKAKTKK